jgi:octaprenyl-diphosphate synthase
LTQNPTLAAVAHSTSPPTAGRILELIDDKLVATDELFRRQLSSDVSFIERAGEYIFEGGGKRMRPALLLLSSRLLGREGDEDVTYAAVIEFIHTATLIHDDIIDHAPLRRNRTTVNKLWGDELTVLLGDWLYTNSMKMALSHGNIEVIRCLCEATLKMTEGELMALQRLRALDLTVDEYFDIIDRKTAHLFGAACAIPALMTPSIPDAEIALRNYGKALGVCFQLVDDLLDFTARETELGKPVLADLKEGKLTLPLILLLPRIDFKQRQLVQQVLEDSGFERTHPEQILDLVKSEGTLDEVTELADESAMKARRCLDFFPHSLAREAMNLAPDFVLNRRS